MDTFASRLERYGEALAVVSDCGERLSYTELARRADEFGASLGRARRLLLLEAANELPALIAYLGALRWGHPVLLASGDSGLLDSIIQTYRPDARFRKDGSVWRLTQEHQRHRDFHPELAVLLSTSGSTGAAKLVRLSYDAVDANAKSISEYLGLTSTERPITTLPIHYSYGLSVVNSHLEVGARLLLTSGSVIDEDFWTYFEREGATSLSGVPYTYELLDRVGLRKRCPSSLRTMTQAGGRLAADSVQAYAEWAEANSVRFFVMYGQTEATARMAYMPSDLLRDYPDCIGVPIPGGHFSLIDEAGAPVEVDETQGELVYSGRNVMLGYAFNEADLAKGRESHSLRTGDLAVRNGKGLYRIVGRKSRFSKLFGLRISFDEVEAAAARRGVRAVVTGDDELLAIAAVGINAARLSAELSEEFGLPVSVIDVACYDEMPTLASGKFDYQVILGDAKARRDMEVSLPERSSAATIEDAYRRAFPRSNVSSGDSFVSLGGDSLGYVRLSLEIEEQLGFLPERWEEQTIADLSILSERAKRPKRKPWTLRAIESEVVLRAAAILAVVINHASAIPVGGGAHVLLLLSGYNLSRYQRARLIDGRGLSILSSFLLRIIVPYYAILAAYLVVRRQFDIPSLLMVSNFSGRWNSFLEPYWFLEALLQCMILFVLLFSFRGVRRFAAANPWRFGLALLCVSLVIRVLAFVAMGRPQLEERTPDSVLFLMAFGWCLHQAKTWSRRLLLTAVGFVIAMLQIVGPASYWPHFSFPSNITHAAWFALAVVLILWLPRVLVPNALHALIGTVAAASFYIYLTHGVPVYLLVQVFGATSLLLCLATSVLLGMGVWWAAQRLEQASARVVA